MHAVSWLSHTHTHSLTCRTVGEVRLDRAEEVGCFVHGAVLNIYATQPGGYSLELEVI